MVKLDKPKILLKVGTATLTRGSDKISRAKLEDIAMQIVELRHKYDIVLVCSGAIAAAKQFIKLEKIGEKLVEKQALASVGQPFLIRLIHDSFRDYEIPIGQCLLSHNDFEHESSKQNIINTINILLENGILPVINENDTTSTDEIRFGDNDKLSALTAALLEVDLLVLATNTNGVYDDEKNTIRVIEDIDDIFKFIDTVYSDQGTGGMHSKLEAARIAQNKNIDTLIVNGHENSFLLNALAGKTNFSKVKAG